MTSYMPIQQAEKHFGYVETNTQEDEGASQSTPPPTIWHRLGKYANNLSTCLVAILLLVNIVMLGRTTNQPQIIPTFQHHDNLTQDLRTYDVDIRYMTLDRKFDHLWDDLLGKDSGNVYIPDAKEGSEDVGAVGVIAMFHQLHCLAHMRKALQDSREGKDIGKDPRDNGHWPHCMDYLRQTFLCQADDVLERLPLIEGEGVAIDGADDIRRCRDSRRLYEMRAQYGPERFQDSTS